MTLTIDLDCFPFVLEAFPPKTVYLILIILYIMSLN